jgi:hypothetical protein
MKRATKSGLIPRRVVRACLLRALLIGGPMAGCGSPGEGPGEVSFPPEPLTTLTTPSGLWQVAVRTFPQPPIKGVDAVQFQITDVDGGGVDGLTVTAVPWMAAHGHGTSARTRVAAQGVGIYQIDNVYLYMDGRWELRSTLAGPEASESVTPVFDVP